MVKRERIAIIPARGASKRLPRKNVVDFFGRPLLAWSIEAGLSSQLFDRIIVSTEDEEIAEIARSHGAEVPFRRERHFDDHSNISEVTIHALEQIADKLGENFDTVVMLQATCPLRDADDVRASLGAFERTNAAFQMSCFRYNWATPWWAFQRDAAGGAKWLFPEMTTPKLRRSQDLPPLFGLTGAICIAKVDALLQSGTFYGPGQRFEPISWLSAVDIDDEEDLAFAKAAYLVKHRISM